MSKFISKIIWGDYKNNPEIDRKCFRIKIEIAKSESVEGYKLSDP